MPPHDFRKPRLFVDADLEGGASVELTREQSNYLGNVLRLSAGDTVLIFNGRDGEWQASIRGRKRPDALEIAARTRVQDSLPELAYIFAPLKHARLDYMVQKAVEMGVSSLQPILTRFTQVSRVNSERMRANVIEAAEQCGILGIAQVAEPVVFDRFVANRASGRLLVFCDEAADAADPLIALKTAKVADGIDVLIGPEGGFAEEERAARRRAPLQRIRLRVRSGHRSRRPPSRFLGQSAGRRHRRPHRRTPEGVPRRGWLQSDRRRRARPLGLCRECRIARRPR